MTHTRHGLSIGQVRIDSEFLLTLKAVGTLTHADYTIISPMIDAALASVEKPSLKVFFDGTELDGWDLRAAWDDFKIGIKHGKAFDKIAIYANKRWLQLSTKIGAWFVTGEVKYIESDSEAMTWLQI